MGIRPPSENALENTLNAMRIAPRFDHTSDVERSAAARRLGLPEHPERRLGAGSGASPLPRVFRFSKIVLLMIVTVDTQYEERFRTPPPPYPEKLLLLPMVLFAIVNVPQKLKMPPPSAAPFPSFCVTVLFLRSNLPGLPGEGTVLRMPAPGQPPPLPPLMVTPSNVRSPAVKKIRKSGVPEALFLWMVAPLPLMVSRLVMAGRPVGPQYPALSTVLRVYVPREARLTALA